MYKDWGLGFMAWQYTGVLALPVLCAQYAVPGNTQDCSPASTLYSDAERSVKVCALAWIDLAVKR